MWRVKVAAAVTAVLLACGGEGNQGGPAPLESVGSAGVGGSGGAAAGGAGGQSAKRTVETRHPFGNVAASGNLLWDGDFEWMTAFADQYGWLYNYSFAKPPLAIGARCRSGIKCADLEAGSTLIGIGVASAGDALDVSVWTRPDRGGCDATAMVLTSFGSDPDWTILPQSATPDTDGWCHFVTKAPERASGVLLFIENQSGGRVLIDDAVVEAAKSTGGARATSGALGGRVGEAALVKARAVARAAMRPRVTPVPKARRQFEERMKRRRWKLPRR